MTSSGRFLDQGSEKLDFEDGRTKPFCPQRIALRCLKRISESWGSERGNTDQQFPSLLSKGVFCRFICVVFEALIFSYSLRFRYPHQEYISGAHKEI